MELKYYYFSLAYSCLQIKKFYQYNEIVANDNGISLVMDTLKLPYESVRQLPDKLNNLPKGLWAYPKVLSYSMQEEPFIHVDNDVYIWERFPKEFESADLVAQNIEVPISVYRDGINAIKKYFPVYPQWLNSYSHYSKQEFIGANAGVIGGNDIEFLRRYADCAVKAIDDNSGLWSMEDTPSLGNTNVVYEQLLFYHMAIKEQKHITTLFDGKDNGQYQSLYNFDDVPYDSTYIHCLGECKKKIEICKKLEYRLCADYYEYYNRIVSLLNVPSVEDTIEFRRFFRSYEVLKKIDNKYSILELPVSLSPNQKIKKIGDKYFRLSNGKYCRLSAWSLFLPLFYESTLTGKDLCDKIMSSYMGTHLAEDYVRDNVYRMIYQYLLNDWLEIV